MNKEIFYYIDHADAVLNSKGVIEVVEFFDYNCTYCKKAFRIIRRLLNNRNDIKIILKAIPIVNELSIYATEIGHAILMSEPNKYIQYFETLMNDFKCTKNPVYDVLVLNNININKLKKILSIYKPRIDEMIKNDLELANKFGIKKTPTFIINGEIIQGILDFNTLNNKIVKR